MLLRCARIKFHTQQCLNSIKSYFKNSIRYLQSQYLPFRHIISCISVYRSASHVSSHKGIHFKFIRDELAYDVQAYWWHTVAIFFSPIWCDEGGGGGRNFKVRKFHARGDWRTNTRRAQQVCRTVWRWLFTKRSGSKYIIRSTYAIWVINISYKYNMISTRLPTKCTLYAL